MPWEIDSREHYPRASDAVARAIDILSDLVGFDTTSANSNLALMRYVEALLAARGVTAELLLDDTGQKANLFATVGPSRPEGVILSGHTDVVPVAEQNWSSDPFVLTQRDTRLYGRGTADMKAFIACSLAALDFAKLDALQRPIHLAFSYDEEVGCLGAPRLIERIADTIALPAVAIVGEPSLMRIIGSHKSVNIYKVTVTGVPAHSSAAHLGLSANALAIQLMNVLLQIAGKLTAKEAHNADFQPPFSTLTVGLMKGGTAANILAAEASFVFDLRSLPEHDPDEILRPFHAEMEALRVAYPLATITFEPQAAVPPLARVLESKAETLVRRVGGDNSDMIAGSFGAEAGQFQQAGFSTVICGPGSIDQAHQADEFIEISEIEKCMIFMDRLFTSLTAQAEAA
ncbi:MAG: acetylornithine deacetylase [Hyphomonadaceae bacterium JAD_PAG50586_4]|nr:MAG: acetylornithine deacetylase [Hyphomonadaceae bacterium JAD_PAG50586_4]